MTSTNTTLAGNSLESLLDQLLVDKALRSEFFEAPSSACAIAGIALSWAEMGALLAVPAVYFDEFSRGFLPHGESWTRDPEGLARH